MAAKNDKGLGPAPDSDPASATKDPAAQPKKVARTKKAKDPEAIAADIERTREELAETLDAIADKVSPKRVAKRTTKKVATAVKDTAHDAAASVKDTATSAKDKVTGTSKSGTDWAPDPGSSSVTAPNLVPDLPPASGVDTTKLPTSAYVAPAVTTPTTYESASSGFKPEYVVAGAGVALLAWLLLRKRK